MSKFWGLLFFRGKNSRRPPGLGTQDLIYHPSLAQLACLALAILASYRPCSPCLHQQQRPRREAPRRPPKAPGVVVAWCRQSERGWNEAMKARQAKALQDSSKVKPPRDEGGRVISWIAGMDPCNTCGKNHLHRDCPDSSSHQGNALESLNATQQAEIAKQIAAYLAGGAAAEEHVGGACELVDSDESASEPSTDWCASTPSSRTSPIPASASQLTFPPCTARQKPSAVHGKGSLGGPGPGPGVSVYGSPRVEIGDLINANINQSFHQQLKSTRSSRPARSSSPIDSISSSSGQLGVGFAAGAPAGKNELSCPSAAEERVTWSTWRY